MRLVGKSHEQGVAVGVGVHRHRADAGVLARPDHAHRDLSAIGDENLLQPLDHTISNLSAGRSAVASCTGSVRDVAADLSRRSTGTGSSTFSRWRARSGAGQLALRTVELQPLQPYLLT
jgi:hypothetical protein